MLAERPVRPLVLVPAVHEVQTELPVPVVLVYVLAGQTRKTSEKRWDGRGGVERGWGCGAEYGERLVRAFSQVCATMTSVRAHAVPDAGE